MWFVQFEMNQKQLSYGSMMMMTMISLLVYPNDQGRWALIMFENQLCACLHYVHGETRLII